MDASKPLLAITMGDPAGIGPETIVGAWRDPTVHQNCRAVVIGRPEVMRRAAGLYDHPFNIVEVDLPEEVESDAETIWCLPCGAASASEAAPAKIDPRGGQAAYDALVLAAELALSERVDGIVTAPLNKAALWAAGHHYAGHTELLGELCGADDVAMMLYLAPGGAICGRAGLGVVHATLHTALRRVFQQLTKDRIASRARLLDEVVRWLMLSAGIDDSPRLGVCALNPHAGERQLFGDEEVEIILPAVETCQAAGLRVEGPLPCDTLMMRAVAGEFDGLVAMYHDQGHIPLKLLGMHRAVNVTLGLPIVRTSVAHGTAFDLAWQGRAETSGMVASIETAAKLVRQRRGVSASRPLV